MIKKIFKVLDPDSKKNAIRLIFLTIIFVIVETFLISLFLPVLQNFFSENAQTNFLVVNFFHYFENGEKILLIFMFFVILIRSIYYLYFNYFNYSFLLDLQKNTSLRLFYNFFSFKSYNDYISLNSSNLIRDLVKEVSTFKKFAELVVILIVEALLILVISIFLMFLNFKIFIFVFLFLLFIGLIYIFLLRKNLFLLGKKRLNISKNIIQNITESFRFFEIIRIQNKLNYFYNKNFNLQNNFKNVLVKISILQVLPKIIVETLFFVGIIGALYLIIKSSNITVEKSILGVFFIGFLRIYPSITKIIYAIQNLKLLQKSVEIIYNQINFKDKKIDNLKTHDFDFKNSIKISNLNFQYNSKYIFNNFNIELKKNSFNAVIGSSGSGKSTLVKILLGLVYPEKINIEVDDNKINLNELSSYFRSNTGYSGQESLALNTNMYENITLEKNDKSETSNYNAKVKNAFTSSGLNEFFNINEDLNKIIDENGKNLSGGQLQRISLARSLFFSNGILILDEICSSLDLDSERKIIDILKKLSSKYLIIYITHRSEFLKNFDQIIKIDKNQ